MAPKKEHKGNILKDYRDTCDDQHWLIQTQLADYVIISRKIHYLANLIFASKDGSKMEF